METHILTGDQNDDAIAQDRYHIKPRDQYEEDKFQRRLCGEAQQHKYVWRTSVCFFHHHMQQGEGQKVHCQRGAPHMNIK
jgi:hypothetical protein